MKNKIFRVIAILAMSVFAVSCTSDDDVIEGTGSLTLKYDNSFGDSDLILSTQGYTTSSSEVIKVNTIKYIISNVVLTTTDGTVYTYPKSESYFIIDESTTGGQSITLTDIPAGDYSSVKFGIGVDKEQYDLGITGQGDFLTTASAAGMTWSWSAGYKFLAFEGVFTSPTVTTETEFKIHNGQSSGNYNYAEVSLDLPTNAQVRTTITPAVHFIVDLGKIVDGSTKFKLSEKATIMGGSDLVNITQNITEMFRVDHVHND
ncbi:MbnP family protein [Flavobacterium algicola]|uniref:MbnP family protein n=1 Tax=Flavobacterium algicola TaxID=556529 RepID=UPI001EFEDECC|nr:MbnP family protein [Flavobacterium algicola]MCG9791274.1 hypothetical protein [Flavobacterium algicola]